MEFVCTECPRGCRLLVENGRVSGNSCPKGEAFGLREATAPMRAVSSTVAVEGGLHAVCPVKTTAPVPKAMQRAAVAALEKMTVAAPIRAGQIILKNVCGTGADFAATRPMPKK